MAWWDFYKIWTYEFEKGPLELSKTSKDSQITGAGVTVPDAMPDLRGELWSGGAKGQVRLHDSNDFIDLSTVTNRQSRYNEYERLRNIPEIEMAMTTISDEACVAGDTKISTLFEGYVSIEKLAARWKKDPSPFLVYCWDFEKQDYTLGWAYDPRFVKREKTLKIKLDDGSHFIVTADHRILDADQNWINAGDLKEGSEIMPFYKINPNRSLNKIIHNQFPRIYTRNGWKNERQFIEDWKSNGANEKQKEVQKAIRLLSSGASTRQTADMMGRSWPTLDSWIKKEGFTTKELKWLGEKRKQRKVIGIQEYNEMNVYDLSVKNHENFCTDSTIMHNCQRDDYNNVLEIECSNEEVKKELEFLCFNRKMLNINRRAWSMVKRLCIFGDGFYELITNPESPKDGILKMQELPPDSMYKIVTTKGKLVEFQQSKEGPDYQSLTRGTITKATDLELMQSTAIRFSPHQVVHMYLGEDRKTFYPYGQSLIEPARGPAHQLRLMEDAMVVYRLSRAPERRVFYIDVGQLPPFKAEAFVERMKDQFRKKKTGRQGGPNNANVVEERWSAPAADEDYWLPIRPQANTRIETLPGAQNLGEIDDALYFRNKLFTALNFPKNYINTEDPNQTRITLSAQDARFARMVERIQSSIEDGILQICETHLEMRGFPFDQYENLKIKMTPPSAWKELSEAEILNNRINVVTQLKSALIMSDYDLLTKFMKYTESEAESIISRNKIQKLEDLKIQVVGQNPQLLGVGTPGNNEEGTEIGVNAEGPNPMLGLDGENQESGPEETPNLEDIPDQELDNKSNIELESPSDEDIKKYDLGIEDYNKTVDDEVIDWSEEK